MFFSFNMFDHPIPRVFQNRFSTQYRCFSVSMLAGPNDRSDVEKGGKIIMPPSALDQLSRLNITYPMLFKLTNKNSDRMTHCGVLEFVADEGICYLPHWMMQNLLLEEGGLVQVESVNLQVATYSKFQPQSPDFLDITNPKAVLENALRNFACLTTGDVIAINYNEKIYELRVMETKPDKAVSIIECDMNVDFDAPLGYKEPERQAQHEESTEGEADHSGYAGELGFRVSTRPLDLCCCALCALELGHSLKLFSVLLDEHHQGLGLWVPVHMQICHLLSYQTLLYPLSGNLPNSSIRQPSFLRISNLPKSLNNTVDIYSSLRFTKYYICFLSPVNHVSFFLCLYHVGCKHDL
uniref:Ubiquitin recognition factor in ER-associated degradation protein 1 n=1 Tax=Saimiri boliviensis boliviensis TaxID=39432 RepID=A0A2K6TPW1_SAIBB